MLEKATSDTSNIDNSLDPLDEAAQMPLDPPAASAAEPMVADLDDDDLGPVGDGQEQADASANDDDRPTFTPEDLAALEGLETTEDAADETEAEGVEEEEAAEEVEDEETASDDEPTEELTEAEATELEEIQTAVADWREEQGIPATADAYEIPEAAAALADAPMLGSFLEFFHAHNLPQETVSQLLEQYAQETGKIVAGNSERDVADAEVVKSTLEASWGDYATSIQSIKNLLEDSKAMPTGTREALLKARLPDGTRLVNNLGVMQWLRNSAKSRYGDPKAQRTERIAEISKVMGTDAYWRDGLDKEYLELTTAENAGLPAERPTTDQARLKEIEAVMSRDINDYWRDPEMQADYTRILALQPKRSVRR
jgi:hypothetical protein